MMSEEKKSHRWTVHETELLEQVRTILAPEIAAAGQFPEVIGDRGIIRFIRGHGVLDRIVTKYRNYLQWRKDNNVDEVRERIRVENLNKPALFPNGEGFLSMSEQIIVAADATDYEGNLITFETFDFSPSVMLKKFSLDDWDNWMIYTMIYKQMVLEQVSEQRERDLLREYNGAPPCTPDEGYGVICQCTSIRCLKGMGMEFLGSDSKAIIKSSIAICQENFPEILHKSHMVQTPWIFNTMWYFCKGLLDSRTLAKVNVHGYTFLDELCKEIPITSIPKHFGGQYMGYNDPFEFDWSKGGLMDLQPELRHRDIEQEHHQMNGGVIPPLPPAMMLS